MLPPAPMDVASLLGELTQGPAPAELPFCGGFPVSTGALPFRTHLALPHTGLLRFPILLYGKLSQAPLPTHLSFQILPVSEGGLAGMLERDSSSGTVVI